MRVCWHSLFNAGTKARDPFAMCTVAVSFFFSFGPRLSSFSCQKAPNSTEHPVLPFHVLSVVWSGFVGVLIWRLPTSLLEHLSVGQARNSTDTEKPVCSPCSHSHSTRATIACVIAKRLCCLDLARACSKTWSFLCSTKRLHNITLFFFELISTLHT